MRVYVLFSIFSPFCLLEYDGWSWRSHHRLRETFGKGGHTYDGARSYKEDGCLTSWRAPRESVSVLFQLRLFIAMKGSRIILSTVVVSV